MLGSVDLSHLKDPISSLSESPAMEVNKILYHLWLLEEG